MQCTFCGANVPTYLSQVKKRTTRFCNQKCRDAYNNSLTDGLFNTRFYKIYRALRGRCDYTDKRGRDYYKGKTYTWNTFKEFKEDMYQSYLEHVALHGERQTTIDRIDNKQGYSEDNCRWATRKEQQRNRSVNHLITIDGRTKTLMEWSEIYEKPYETIRQRLKRGWSVEAAMNEPVGARIHPRNDKGQYI